MKFFAFRPLAIVASFAFLILSLVPKESQACTAFFSGGSDDSFVAKNLDWYTGDGMIFVNKRSLRKQGVLVGGQRPASWLSKYMNVTLTQSGRDFPWEGMNEAGLSVNCLELLPSQVPGAEDPRPALEMLQWIQYILDTSANVKEAIEQARKVRVGVSTTIHYFVCDSSSACAVFEYIHGALVVHAGPDLPYRAIANNNYEESVDYFRTLIKTTAVSVVKAGTSDASLDRFSRAVLWSPDYSNGPESDSDSDSASGISKAFTALANLAETHPTWRTVWSMVFGLKSHIASLTTLAAPGVKSIDLGAFNPDCSSGTQMLDINEKVTGDARAKFQPYSPAANRALIERNTYLPPSIKPILESYPESETRCEDTSSL